MVQVDGREAINFSSNNYLGLADSPALRAAARASLDEDGVGAGASRLIVGSLRPHRRLEDRLAAFACLPAALAFNSGYHANVGALSALAGPGDLVFSDALNHASVIDGCRLSRARTVVYPHLDLTALEAALRSNTGRRRFIVTDTVFSMDGDLAPLGQLRILAARYGAALVVDEAHATGVIGPGGRGLCAAMEVAADVHVATLGKALGAFGAFVAGSSVLVEFLANRARSFVFTTALPPSVCAAAEAALNLVSSPEGASLRERLATNVRHFGSELRRMGLLSRTSGATPIFPVLVGDARRAMAASERLLSMGIYAQGIRPPTVREGTARLRFALMATHTPAQLDVALDGLATLQREHLLPEQQR